MATPRRPPSAAAPPDGAGPAPRASKAGRAAGAAAPRPGQVERTGLPLSAQLQLAPDLDALLQVAAASALAPVLEEPAQLFLETCRLSDRAAQRLEQWLDEVGAGALGGLLAAERRPGLRRALGAPGLVELTAALRSFLEEERAAREPVAEQGLRVEMSPGAVAAFARAHGAEAALARPLGLVVEAPLSAAASRMRLDAALCCPVGPSGAGAQRLEIGVKRDVVRVLQAHVDLLPRLRAEAQVRIERSGPGSPTLAAVAAGLRALRAPLAERCAPPLVLALDRGRLEWRPAERLLRLPVGLAGPLERCAGGAPRVAELHIGEGGAIRLSCACGPEAEPCPWRLRAIDHLLEVLAAPGEAGPVLAQVEREAGRAAWHAGIDALDALDAALSAAQRPALRPDEALGWLLVRDEERVVSAQPLLVRSTAEGWQWRRPPSAAPAALHPLCERPGDHRALDALLGLPASALPAAARRLVGLRQVVALLGHPRVFRLDEGARSLSPLPVRGAALGLLLRPDAEGGALLEAELDGQVQPMDRLAERLAGLRGEGCSVIFEDGALSVVSVEDSGLDLLIALAARDQRFPPDGVDALFDRLDALDALLPVRIDPELRGEEAEPSARPRAVLKLLHDSDGALALRLRLRVQPLPDARLRVPGQGPPIAHGRAADGGRRWASRDRGEELWAAKDLAARLGLSLDAAAEPWAWFIARTDEALLIVQRLEAERTARPGALEVVWDGERPAPLRTAEAAALQLQVGGGRDWFGLSGGLEVDGVIIELEALLQMVAAGRRYLAVEGRGWVALQDSLREQLEALEQLSRLGPEGRAIPAVGVGAVEALARAGAEIEADERWAALRARVQAAERVEVSAPAGLRATLRPYQLAGLRWMAQLASWGAGAVLADDMGLGKTVQALALLLLRAGEGPALVVAPTSVEANWLSEAARFAPGLEVWAHRARRPGAGGSSGAPPGPAQVVVVSYGLLVRDQAELGAVAWATVVLDEAHAIKNSDTARARAARALNAGFVLALTGTPVENRVSELWSLLSVTAPGLLGSLGRFRETFVGPIEREGDRDRRARLAALIRPFVLRRRKSEVAPELPPRTERSELLPMSPPHRARYEAARAEALQGLSAAPELGEEARRLAVLAALTRLRLLACHPALVSGAGDFAGVVSKLERLRALLAELRAAGQQVLVFSQFVRHLDLVEAALLRDGHLLCRLDGGTPVARRQAQIERFQAGQADVFLISLQAGGVGLNLTAASAVIHLDPWWNPAVEDQATGRAHRIGQARPVTVIRLITEGTVEQTVLEMHADKRELVSGLLSGTEAAARLDLAALAALVTASAGLAIGGPDEGEAETEAEDEVGADRYPLPAFDRPPSPDFDAGAPPDRRAR